MSARPFPGDFLWGAATSAYQIEGSPLADGAGPSLWHCFAHEPGRTHAGDTGDVACDDYRRWAEDVALLRELGLNAYRFSVSWSRILPSGSGAPNPAGLGHYDRLVDALLEAGIAPNLTLYHGDLPAALNDRGDWFGDYATVLVRALGDRVALWATLNEPRVVVEGGYRTGVLAPGHRDLRQAAVAGHNLLRASATAVQAFRAEARSGTIGLVLNIEPQVPACERSEDAAAAVRADACVNRWFLEPALLGRYPEELPGLFGDAWPGWPAAEIAGLAQPLDWLGVNYYTRAAVRADDAVELTRAARVPRPGVHTETGWEVYPPGLRHALDLVRARAGELPLYVTGNGAAFPDPAVAGEDPLPDPERVRYLREHLRVLRDALAAGLDVRGYFAWSLLDSFEWAHGYSRRFGLVHVDFATQRRTLKVSAHAYRDIVRSRGERLDVAG